MAEFDYFVVFAEMRTGSNFLEANINAFEGMTCHGEAFNPNFIGYPSRDEVLGLSQEDRDTNPTDLLDRVKAADGLNGFRYFNSHDDRVCDTMLDDPRCAKIILTRNPIESYVSWKIAKATGQWKLMDVKRLREDTVEFSAPEFEKHVAKMQAFQVRLMGGLQRSGQTAFYIDYEDLQDVDVMNGLAAFLGSDARLSELDKSLKKQNPSPMSDKVVNFDEMEDALARLDRFNLNRTPNFEPRRGPSVPTFVAAPMSPLLYMPIRSGPESAVTNWLSELDDANLSSLITGFTQKSLRDWKRQHIGHRSFTVVRHPVARAHAAFCSKILQTGEGTYVGIRQTLSKQFKWNLPEDASQDSYTPSDHKAAFLGFLRFVKSNLGGQTAIRVDSHWATQANALQGFAEFVTPDLVLREDRLQDDLGIIAAQIGKDIMPVISETDPYSDKLAGMYDAEVEAAVKEVYQRDYDAFGFGPYA
ncbi:sulfotransferase family 2 domain-containing protein [Octadecabacter sp. 1_MG-2023]|uniref:sulfotransferase family 2 domain-containing protein n=1 Tax=unclassified Octadecabacter TaxID=196158 RepID=UPI001C07F5CA|nr:MULTISPECIES: sulfotransferase family 2 domain-containing protein [unclassified Octadecabacter]MBU2992251.1 sulfotransferase family protein [Octadecabacter sp. B2R22]MDO6734993.1 sulfotransferase family 2 domain-containing protein [Octadecabacter sp. 1_MG-2023]